MFVECAKAIASCMPEVNLLKMSVLQGRYFVNFPEYGKLFWFTEKLASTAFTCATTCFFIYCLVIRKKTNSNWVIRPPCAGKHGRFVLQRMMKAVICEL